MVAILILVSTKPAAGHEDFTGRLAASDAGEAQDVIDLHRLSQSLEEPLTVSSLLFFQDGADLRIEIDLDGDEAPDDGLQIVLVATEIADIWERDFMM